MFHSTAFQVSFCIYINKRWIRIPAWDFWEKTFAIQPHCCLCSLDVDGSQVVNTNESFYLSSTLSTRHWYHFVWERRCWRRDAGGSWIILMPTFIRTEYFLFPFCYSMEEEERVAWCWGSRYPRPPKFVSGFSLLAEVSWQAWKSAKRAYDEPRWHLHSKYST